MQMPEKTSRHVTNHAQAAWRRVHELDLLPSPENYSVLFAYYEGTENELKLAVEEALKMSGRDPIRLAEVFLALYDRFLSTQKHEDFLHGATGKFDQEIQAMLSMVASANSGAESYNNALNTFTNDLSGKEVSAEQMQAMIARMQQETRNATEQNNALREKLHLSLNQVKDLRNSLDSVRREALIDPLTGIGNRKAFTADLTRVTQEASRKNEVLCVIMIDIDFFKKFNDKYGHLVGDQVLKLVASTLKENIKGLDSVARWGGEEFAVLLPQTTLADAVKVGDHLRKVVASKKIIRKPQNEDLGVITLSMGTTQYMKGEEITEFVDRADKGLYQAKQDGRNRVVAVNPPSGVIAKKPPLQQEQVSISVGS